MQKEEVVSDKRSRLDCCERFNYKQQRKRGRKTTKEG